jgi:hypothetical protein
MRAQRTETKLRHGVDGFLRNIQAQITQEGILVYIKCIISSPCILEGLIYTSNNVFVQLSFERKYGMETAPGTNMSANNEGILSMAVLPSTL